jgi:hypothetical protein
LSTADLNSSKVQRLVESFLYRTRAFGGVWARFRQSEIRKLRLSQHIFWFVAILKSNLCLKFVFRTLTVIFIFPAVFYQDSGKWLSAIEAPGLGNI